MFHAVWKGLHAYLHYLWCNYKFIWICLIRFDEDNLFLCILLMYLHAYFSFSVDTCLIHVWSSFHDYVRYLFKVHALFCYVWCILIRCTCLFAFIDTLNSNKVNQIQPKSIKHKQNLSNPSKINQLQVKSIKSKPNQSNSNKIKQIQIKSTELKQKSIKSNWSNWNQSHPNKINQIQVKSIKSKQNQTNPNKINQIQTKSIKSK